MVDIRRAHRKKATRLSYAIRWEIAYKLFFEGVPRKVLAVDYKICLSYVHRIKEEFIEVKEVWRNKAPPDQAFLPLKVQHKVDGYVRTQDIEDKNP